MLCTPVGDFMPHTTNKQLHSPETILIKTTLGWASGLWGRPINIPTLKIFFLFWTQRRSFASKHTCLGYLVWDYALWCLEVYNKHSGNGVVSSYHTICLRACSVRVYVCAKANFAHGFLVFHFFHTILINISRIPPHGDVIKWKYFTGPLCVEFTGSRWIPLTKASDAELWCFLWSASEQTVE